MGTITDKLDYLEETKTAIKNAITAKGVSVSDTDTFRSYANKIDSIDTSHYTAVPVLGSSDSISNTSVATDNAATYLNIIENGAKSGGIQIKGLDATVVSALNGVLTIKSANTKVTSASNHYNPLTDSSSALNKDASSTTSATWGTTSLVTGVNISRDSKGHVTDLSLDSVRMPSNPNTTYEIASGDANGQIKVTPSVGGAYNVDVTGLKSAAYTESSAYAKLSHSHGIDEVKGLPQDLEGIHQSLDSMQTSIDSKADNQTFVDSQKSLENRIVAHTTNKANPHEVTAAQIGLSLSNGTITLGNDSITPLTANSTLNAGKVSGTLAASNIPDLDASKIKTGTISVDRLPATALERCIVVPDNTARFALTVSNVQVGDTVKVTDTKKMYMVVDSSKLFSDAGYEEYVTSTDWTAITGIPKAFPPSKHSHTKSEITDFPTLATVATSGNYNDLSNKPTIPSKTSELNNDSGFLTLASLPSHNAFSKVAVGSTTIEADSGTDTLTLAAGNNITLASDTANDKITISATGFLPLAGGNVSGITKFTNTTDSTAPQNGAVVISGGLGVGKNIYADAVYNAVWNDLADCIPVDDACKVEPGYCYCFDGERYYKSTRYLDKGIIGINSDTYGINMGHKPGVNNQMDIAVAGFVLAYVDKEYEPGTPLTCTENGYLTEIKREDKIEYPERVVATYWKSEPKEYWGSSNSNRLVEVHGRKWVKVV